MHPQSNLDISADGRFVGQAMYYAGSIVLDRQTGKTTAFQPQGDVRYVAVHPNGSLLASFGWAVDGFRLWETKNGKAIHAGQGSGPWGRFTPDGKYLIMVSGDLCSVPDCKVVRKFTSWVEFAISPDSRYLAAAEPGGKVRLNRIDNGELIAQFRRPRR